VVNACRRGLVDRSVAVEVDGGELLIEWGADDRVRMTGPVALERMGDLPKILRRDE
jgi:diaminopimelate epimerase